MSDLFTQQTAPAPAPDAVEELQRAYMLTAPLASAERLWTRCLTMSDRNRLGGDFLTAYARHNSSAAMWVALHGGTMIRGSIVAAKHLSFIDQGTANWLLREHGEHITAQDAMDTAIQAGCLVLRESPREAYWAGEMIDIDWASQSKSWDFFLIVAQHAKINKSVDAFCFGENCKTAKVNNWKSRLKGLANFPSDLGKLIVPAGRGTTKVNLPAGRIQIFAGLGDDSLKEWRR